MDNFVSKKGETDMLDTLKYPTVFTPRFINSFFNAMDDIFEDSKSIIPYNVVQIIQDKRVTATQIEVALAVYDKADIKLKIVGEELQILVEKTEKKENATRQYLHKGISGRSFQLKFTLPGVYDKAGITSTFKNGLLTVNIPVLKEEIINVSID